MIITDTTDMPQHKRFLEEAWGALPRHWQKAMDTVVGDGTEIIGSPEIICQAEKPDVAWFYHPIHHLFLALTSTGLEDLMAFLRMTKESYQVCCAWRFKVNFVSPAFYFKKHFLRTLVIAVYLQHDELRRIVSEQSEMEKDSVEAELFFGDTFYKWCMYDRSEDGYAEGRYGRALACLDRIDEKAKSLFSK